MTNGAINTKKCASELSEYIWESPFLKPFFFNPFILSILVICIIWMVDHIYYKRFIVNVNLIQHGLTTYILVATPILINNMLIKHYYRQKKIIGNYDPPITEEVEEYSESV
jgi:hypothetical protein